MIITDVLYHFEQDLYDLQESLDTSPLDKQSLIEKIRKLTEIAFSKANATELNALKLKKYFFCWIETHATQVDLVEDLIDEVEGKYQEAQGHTNTQLTFENQQANVHRQEVVKVVSNQSTQIFDTGIELVELATQNRQAAENNHIAAQELHERIVDAKKEADQISDQVNEIQQFMEDFDQSLEALLKDYQAKLNANQQEENVFLSVESVRKTFRKLFNFVKESLNTNEANPLPPTEANETWNKLVDLIVAEECFVIKHIKKYFIQQMKTEVEKAYNNLQKHCQDHQHAKYERLLKEAELSFYRDILGHLIDVTSQKQKALKEHTASKEQQKVNQLKGEISFINKEFLHYFGKYRRLHSLDDFLFTSPTDLIVSKYYANLGYSKWDHICELFDLEENEGWQIPLAIPAIMRKNGGEFLQWVDTHPHSASIMAADLALTHSILKQDDALERFRKTLQTHTFTLTFLDALGFCQDEPLHSQQELKFKALADFIAQAPLLVTLLAQLMSHKALWKKISGSVIDLLVNSTIQNLNRAMSADTRNNAQIAISILKGQGLQEILTNERNRRLIQLAGGFKQAIQRPQDVYAYFQEKWNIWWETIQRSSNQEKIERLFVQIAMPIVGTMAAVAYLVAGMVKNYFSFWKGLSLAIGISSLSFYLSHRFYQFLNSRYKETYEAAENHVKGQFKLNLENSLLKENVIEDELKTFVDNEVGNLQRLYQIPRVPERLQERKADDDLLIKKLETHMEGLLNHQLNEHIQKGKKESIELYIQVFNEVFVMKDVKQTIETLVCAVIEFQPDSLTKEDFPSRIQFDELLLKEMQKDLQLLLDKKEDDFLHHAHECVFLLSHHLINHWLKEKFISFWKKSLFDEPQEVHFVKQPLQDVDSEIRKNFASKGLMQQYQTLFS